MSKKISKREAKRQEIDERIKKIAITHYNHFLAERKKINEQMRDHRKVYSDLNINWSSLG